MFLMLDNDAQAEMTQAENLLKQQSLRVVPITLPDARDPADYSVEAVTEMLLDRASAANVLEALT